MPQGFVEQRIEDDGTLSSDDVPSEYGGYITVVDDSHIHLSIVGVAPDGVPMCNEMTISLDGTLEDYLSAGKSERDIGGLDPRSLASQFHLMLAQLLYLVSKGTDLERATPPYRHPEKMRRKGIPMPVTWDVGARIGPVLRDSKRATRTHAPARTDAREGTPEEGPDGHRPPCPHVRRGHWHTYLRGKGRQSRELRWVHPCLVRFGEGHDPSSHERVRQVKK